MFIILVNNLIMTKIRYFYTPFVDIKALTALCYVISEASHTRYYVSLCNVLVAPCFAICDFSVDIISLGGVAS